MRAGWIVRALALACGCALASGFVGAGIQPALHPLGLRGCRSASIPNRWAMCGVDLGDARGGLRVTKDISDIEVLGDALNEWGRICEEQGVEAEGKGGAGLSKKERVEYVFRAVVSQERTEVLRAVRAWVPYALSEHPRCAVLGSIDKDTGRLMAVACVEAAPAEGDEGGGEAVRLQVRNVAVRPDEDPGEGMAGGWTAGEDYSALSMCEGVKAHARHLELEPDFGELADVHEGRIFLKTDPFSPGAFGGML